MKDTLTQLQIDKLNNGYSINIMHACGVLATGKLLNINIGYLLPDLANRKSS